jgi:glucose 1-dehydrogenase
MDSQRLQGEIAIVTGSDSGIGQATAFAFAKEGANVAVKATFMTKKGPSERKTILK